MLPGFTASVAPLASTFAGMTFVGRALVCSGHRVFLGGVTSSCLAPLDAFARLSSLPSVSRLAARVEGGFYSLGTSSLYDCRAVAWRRSMLRLHNSVVACGYSMVPCGYREHTGGMSLHGRVGMWGIGAHGKFRRSRSGRAGWIPVGAGHDVIGEVWRGKMSRIAAIEDPACFLDACAVGRGHGRLGA